MLYVEVVIASKVCMCACVLLSESFKLKQFFEPKKYKNGKNQEIINEPAHKSSLFPNYY